MDIRKILTGFLIMILLLVVVLLPAHRAQAATITVTTNNDVQDSAANCAAVTLASLPGTDGVVSLREAICAANNNTGADTINFNIPGAGPHTIMLLSALPQLIDSNTTIDGYSQAGAAPATDSAPATLKIAINGAGILNNGLNITSSGNIIQGLAIYGFAGNGIWVANYGGGIANNNVIAGNQLGSNASISLCPGNGLTGIFIGMGAQNNLVGGDSPAERNLIFCNGWEGVGIHGADTTGNTVSGNYIGTDPTGTLPKGNTLQGVRIYGGAHGNTIGGDTSAERNLISGNTEEGVSLTGSGVNNNTVSGNYIGSNANGSGILPNGNAGIVIQSGAQSNIVGGDNATPGGSCTGACNLISGNASTGILIVNADTNNNQIVGNYIGPNAIGMFKLGNYSGIVIGDGASNNLIGGDTPAERNLISGNSGYGIYIYDVTRSSNKAGSRVVFAPHATQGNSISGNYIGTDVTGMAAIPNDTYGVSIGGNAESNTINDNLISGNSRRGVSIQFATGNFVYGNKIGTNAAGTAALANGEVGVYLGNSAEDNTIGGDTPAERNLISGNGEMGVVLTGVHNTGNIISGNYIGVDAAGTADLGNFFHGLVIQEGAHDNTIGGDTAAERNIISGSGNYGVAIFDAGTDGNLIAGNYIGTDANGSADLGNGGIGVIVVRGAQNNTIGPNNRIAYNGHGGVVISGADTTGNIITQNSVYANEIVGGISLEGGGNNDMPAPNILFTLMGSVIIQGTARPGSTVELFASPTDEGQGYLYLGSAVADPVGAYTLEIDSLPYPYLTATATDTTDGTSEFSSVFTSTLQYIYLPLTIR